MHWLQSLDVSLFRFINQTLSNPVFDVVMPFLSGNAWSFPIAISATVLIAFWLIWKDRPRGAVCVLVLALVLGTGDMFISNAIKTSVARLRPFAALADVHKLVKAREDVSMPSSHAANWAAATMILFIYYRRSLLIMLPLAVAVSFSRVYNGVHYPSDVLVGAILGAGYAAGGAWTINALWQWAGRRWFPNRWKKLPSLLVPELTSKT